MWKNKAYERIKERGFVKRDGSDDFEEYLRNIYMEAINMEKQYIAYNTNTGKLLHSGEQYIFTREELLEVANKTETSIDSYVIHEIANTPTKCFCVDLEGI